MLNSRSSLAQRTSLIWEPTSATTPPRQVAAQSIIALEAEILAILENPLQPGETISAGYQRLENELGRAFARLTIADARELQRRISNPTADDVLVARFGRMVLERRQRLIRFLADAPRRAAMQGRVR